MKQMALVLGVMCLGVAASLFAQAKPVVSEFFRTFGGGAMLEKREMSDGESASIKFQIQLKRLKELPPGAVVVFEFENGAVPAAPFIVEKTPAPSDDSILAISPLHACVRNNHSYKVRATLYTDRSKQQSLGVHEQELLFRVPKAYIESLKLKVCDV